MRLRVLSLALVVTCAAAASTALLGTAHAGSGTAAPRWRSATALQVFPPTADALGLDASSARTNVLAGARYLRQLLDRFESRDLALAAYNAGAAAVERSGGAPSGETITYVANVTAVWRSLRGCR
jgi:Transglycosylase SLT domain